MKILKIEKLLFALLFGLASCNQKGNPSKGLINEVMLENQTNYQDDYGVRSSWIEIFNKSFANLDIAGYTLRSSCQDGDTISYIIPKGDVQTIIKPRQHTLFWADQQPGNGTFHTTLKLDPLTSNWIGFYDNSGKLLDEIIIPAQTVKTDESYARISDASEKWEVRGKSKNKHVTPSTNNTTIDKNPKVAKFSEQDKYGYGMAITAMSVVFSGLLVLFISFKILSGIAISIGLSIMKKSGRTYTKVKKALTPSSPLFESKEMEKTTVQNEEVYAAIALALHEYQENEIHDEEPHILTINPSHSAWNDHNTTLRKMP